MPTCETRTVGTRAASVRGIGCRISAGRGTVPWGVVLALALAHAPGAAAGEPIALHPENPRYFLFRGEPTILVTSAEHYGAVLNRDFDYVRYLDELQAHGLNYTRIFVGAYVEPPGAFNIARNTLAPAPGRFICPWARSDEPGYAGGGNKFDLDRWDEDYFRRLRDFVAQAGRRGVVVEVTLFCPYYEEGMWALSPLNAANNVNGIGTVARTEALSLKDEKLLAVQQAMVRKVVAELNAFDNYFYEACNEPYIRNLAAPEWERRIIDTIVEAQRDLPRQHLIAQNIANGAKKIEDPHPAVSIFNFHYAFPPDAVAMNYHLGRVIGNDETGFRGTGDRHYRREGWEFLIAGGGLYNNLDYSFAVGYEDGTFEYPSTQPGGGGRSLRRQMAILKEFLHGFDFLRMKPDNGVIRGGVPADGSARALVEPGRQYAIYVHGGTEARLTLELPAGAYRARWVNTRTGEVDRSQDLDHGGGPVTLTSSRYEEDIALRIVVR